MINFSLPSFINICLLDTGGRISRLQKRLEKSNGYDFYKPLHRAIRLQCEKRVDEAEAVLSAPSNDAERKHNKRAFDAYIDKFGTIRSRAKLKSKKTLSFTSSGISITVDPLFSFEKAGGQSVFSVWPSQEPELTQKYGAVACFLMREAYKSSPLANSQFFLADLVSGKTFSEKQITNNTNLIVSADIASIGRLLKEL